VWDIFVRLLAPTAPHLAEHLWTRLGHEGFVAHAAWPSVISELLITDEILVVVQVNGKVRARLLLPSEITDADKQTAALQCLDIQPWLQGKTLVKVVVPAGGKIVSIVVRDV
jgi:leucyl-tRNA synthetase